MLKLDTSAVALHDGEPAAFGRLCVETVKRPQYRKLAFPAAFGRLCVETLTVNCRLHWPMNQPPSGGCVLKPPKLLAITAGAAQPPSGGCVLKPENQAGASLTNLQPPSGGCVLKQESQS